MMFDKNDPIFRLAKKIKELKELKKKLLKPKKSRSTKRGSPKAAKRKVSGQNKKNWRKEIKYTVAYITGIDESDKKEEERIFNNWDLNQTLKFVEDLLLNGSAPRIYKKTIKKEKEIL